ncbi:MAG: SGNH/GDSL hydrolase family protein [Chitinophagales bacterium]
MSRSKAVYKNILVFLFALIFSLSVFEFVSRKWLHLGNDYPNSSLWYKEKWLENHETPQVTLTGYGIDKYDPLLGWTLKENLRNVDAGGWKVSSNSKGVRGVEEHSIIKSKKLRILAIGDSFTFGECVNDTETFPYYLGLALDSAEVINLAVHGYGQDQALLRLENEGLKYKPDVVVMGFLNDDMNRNRMWFKDYAKPYFEAANGPLTLKGTPVIKPEKLLNIPRIKSISLLAALISVKTTQDFDDYTNQLCFKIVERISYLCDSINAPLVLVYMPWKEECIDNRSWHPLLDSISLKKQALVLDPTAAMHTFLMKEKVPEEHFNCHYSPQLNNIIGKEIETFLRTTNRM